MKLTEQMAANYLESKKYAWSPTTLRSERHRLNAVIEYLDGRPETLWEALQSHKPYTRLTIWTRVVDFVDWALESNLISGNNPYRKWRKQNARQFKHVYNPKKPSITFKEAEALIHSLKNEAIRTTALDLLHGGLRFCETSNRQGDIVLGKGSKQRTVYTGHNDSAHSANYHAVWRALRGVGLTPHVLRKICATELAKTLNVFDLCEAMGWESVQTAKVYVAADQDRIKAAFQSLQGGSKDEHREKPIS